ncbi:hypothetical protein CH275_12765 [Rhodococcus sp. 06-235-1A]|uniref:ABC transporter substrate-binding protein n=1 Tax=Rhodococcus sp. 06-235-1A TaxID=2022508 RepID=UPI000B9A5A28|nr:ABC transporter substrate-binding protein [Rhodococcus sp. 06-235-1A]OZD05210.1 hypothetical protein CH275_12765 [Rhodococcus sp. 06-235-1A]
MPRFSVFDNRSTSRMRRPASARRYALAGSLSLALVALVGCSSATTDLSDTADGARTRTVQDYFGPVEVPAEPARVVAADPISLALMLSLDAKPVAASFNPLALPAHVDQRAAGVENIAGEGGGFDPNVEAILAQDPDLIVVVAGYDGEGEKAWNKPIYDKLAASGVPTYGFAYNDGVSLDDVSNGVASVGEVLGKQDKAEHLMQDLTERMAELKQRVSDTGLADKPVSAVRLSERGEYSIRVGTGESIAFRGLGMAQPEGQQDPSVFRIDITDETLNILASADTLFVYNDEGSDAERDAISTAPLWSTLPAVQQDRVHWVSASAWNSSDPIGLGLILDDIETLFIEPAEQS